MMHNTFELMHNIFELIKLVTAEFVDSKTMNGP